MAAKTSRDDVRHMRRALSLAERGRGRVSPNPIVGAVVVKDGRVVGEGWHRALGEPHAEAMALERAGERARGATMIVTLEPCAHRAPATRTASSTAAVCARCARRA
jgi:diaminohydroxyphosphoribosylaminopyrimidine deaminase/5-amino-6-(5-phosphoribosylamino)uracil reductase